MPTNEQQAEAVIAAVTVNQVQTAINDFAAIAAKAAYGANNLTNLNDLQTDVKKIATDLGIIVKVVGSLILVRTGVDAAPPS